MRLGEAFQQAVNEPDNTRRRELVEDVVMFMRRRFRWTYVQCAQFAVTHGVTSERWDELMAELDEPRY